MSFNKLASFTQKVADAADQIVGNPVATKAIFDAAPEELRTYFNNLVDALKSTASGDSGAKNLGVTSISGIDGTDVQTILEKIGSISTKLDANPYFHLNNNTGQSMSGAFTYITFSPAHVNYSSGFTPANNSITVNQDGVYFLESWISLSGLNPGIKATLFMRVINADNSLNADHAIEQIGWDGAGGNIGGVVIRNSKLLRLTSGQMIQFLFSCGEQPRIISQIVANCYKVSKL